MLSVPSILENFQITMRLSLSLLRRVLAASLLAVLAAVPLVLSAHEIPNDVTIHTFVRVEGSQVRLYVRVPLIAVRDIIIPQKDADNIDLSRSDSQLHDAATLWVGDDVKMFENERPLEGQQVVAVRATPVEDRSFDTFEAANLLLTTPQRDVDVAVKTGYLDILFGYPIQSADSHFSIDPKWARLGVRTLTTVRFVLADGTIRPLELEGNPGLVRLDPTMMQSVRRFLTLGLRHVLSDDTDHILFLLCLVVPFRRVRSVATLLLSFAAAYTLTLVAGSFGYGPDSLWFAPFVDLLVAVSILYIAVENIAGADLRRRWVTTFAIGLVHGFSFAFIVRPTLQFAGSHTLASVLAFNLGVTLSQIGVLAVAVPVMSFLFARIATARLGAIILSGVVAHTAWHWMTDRFSTFWQYDLTPPEFTPAVAAELLRYAMVLVALAGMLWGISVLTKGRGDAEARL